MKFTYALLAAAPVALSAPIHEARGSAIAGEWLAVLKPDAAEDGLLSSIADTVGLTHRASYKIGGFRGLKLSSESDGLIDTLAALADIAYIEPDQTITINALTTQEDATWGLARISSLEPGTSTYTYDDSAGEGTYAYIVDTGIYTAHEDFGGRAEFGVSFVEGEEDDGNGHGTHVAGTIGSATWGVSKKTNLIAVKVLDAEGSGSLSDVVAGLEWVVNDATSKNRIGKAVANLSLGGSRLLDLGSATNDAAAAAVEAGVFLAVAAGNDGLPAFLSTPASEPTVCTVGATERDDSKASFSNFGSLVDVFAPGVNITSTWNDGKTNTISGTSMAAPHIAGLGAYLLGLEGPRDPIALCERIQELAGDNAEVTGSLSSNNILAYNGASS